MFVKSNNIKFYPTGYRGNTETNYCYDPESKLNTEENSRRAYNTLITYKDTNVNKHVGDVVISKDYEYAQPPQDQDYKFNKFEFIISGYYVKLLDADKVFYDLINSNNNGKSIYAEIKIVNRGLDEKEKLNPSGSSTVDEDNTAIICRSVISLKSPDTSGQSISTVDDATRGNENSNLDIDGDFTGVNFIISNNTKIDESNGIHVFKILEKNVDNQWKVPNSSKMLITLDDIYGGYELDAASSTLKTKNTITEYITKDTTVDKGNNSYIKLDDESIKIHVKPEEVSLDSEIDVDSSQIKLEQSSSNVSAYIKMLSTDGTSSDIEIYNDYGVGTKDPSTISIKKGNLKLYQGNVDNEISLNNENNYSEIGIHSKNNIDIDINKQSFNKLNLNENGGYLKFYKNDRTGTSTNYNYYSTELNQQEMSITTTKNVGADQYVGKVLMYSAQNSAKSPLIPGISLVSTENGIQKKYSVIRSDKVETPLVYLKDKSIYFGSEVEEDPYTYLPNIKWVYTDANNKYFTFQHKGATTDIYAKGLILQGTGTETDTILQATGVVQASSFYTTGIINTNSLKATGEVTANSFYATDVVNANSFYARSDRRLKENIQPFDYNKSILDLPVYTYNYINGDKKQIGCIAQDLQKLYPELVKEDDKGYLSVDNSKVVYLLLEELKKSNEKIKNLEDRLSKLEK